MKLKKQFKYMKGSNSKVNDSTNIKQGLKEGVIKDRYTDLKGETMFFIVEVLDKKFNSTFLVKLSKEDYQKTYVGQEVDIKRGFKKSIEL